MLQKHVFTVCPLWKWHIAIPLLDDKRGLSKDLWDDFEHILLYKTYQHKVALILLISQ